MTHFPTAWQRKILWNSITIIAITAVSAIAMCLIVLAARAVSFLQPVLIPFAVAAVLAFLLDPVVRLLCTRTRLPRTWSVIVVFAFMALVVVLLLVSVVPRLYHQTTHLAHDLPDYTLRAQKRLLHLLEVSQRKLDQLDHLFPGSKSQPSPSPALPEGAGPSPADNSTVAASPAAVTPSTPVHAAPVYDYDAAPDATPTIAASPESEETMAPSAAASPTPAIITVSPPPSTRGPLDTSAIRDYIQQQLPDMSKQAPALFSKGWTLLLQTIGGVAGGVGLLLNAIIIPVYLFFLLVESRNIGRHWNEYLPLQDSPLKQEVVSVMMEINGYLVAFFRGQLIVSTIDGLLIGSALYFFVGLDFAFFVGLLVVVLTFIPYLGIILCYVPAILIALVQYGDWQHPFYVVLVMFTVQTLEGFIIAPYIVGDSVGLHPLTVIISIFGWSLLLEGPLGAILAVPLTAALKVLLRRYIWEKQERERERRLVPTLAAESGGHPPPPETQPPKEHLPPPAPAPVPAAQPAREHVPPAPDPLDEE
jgi:predicted PurR-regulated permease PerM